MKDYLNTVEKNNIVIFLKTLDILDNFISENKNNGSLTNDELKSFRQSKTWLSRAITSLINRLNENTLKSLKNNLKHNTLYLDNNCLIELHKKKKSTRLNDMYKLNRDYFKLVELIMYYNCKNCSADNCECDLYKEFEKMEVPEFIGEFKNCKYAYKGV